MFNSIETEWLGFAEMVFRKTKASPTQVAEMRKAFFAGAWAVLTATLRIGEASVSEVEAIKYFDDRKAECEQFSRELLAEYAERN